MIAVTVDYDTRTQTWNAMEGANCIFYGSAWQVDAWLIANKLKYIEVKKWTQNTSRP